MIVKSEKINNISFSFLMIYAIFMPSFFSTFGRSGSFIINGGLIFLLLVCVLKFDVLEGSKVFITYSLLILSFFIVIPISMFIGVVFGGIELNIRDFYEFYRPLLYFLTFLYSYRFFISKKNTQFFECLLAVVFIISTVFGVNHYLGFIDSISEKYTKTLNIDSFRVSTPFVNPYDYAFFMSFFVLYYFVKFIYSSIYYFFLFLVSIVMMILPQSRSVAVGFLIAAFIVMPLVIAYLSFNLKRFSISNKAFLYYFLFVLLLLSFVFSIPYLMENFRYLTGQFVRLIEQGDIGRSAGIRVQQFVFALGKASDNALILFFGNGPAKNEMQFVESIYNFLFYRYGLVGFSLYFFTLFLTIYFSVNLLKNTSEKNSSYPLHLAILIWLISIPFLSIGNNFTEQVRLSYFYYVIIGFVVSSYYKSFFIKVDE